MSPTVEQLRLSDVACVRVTAVGTSAPDVVYLLKPFLVTELNLGSIDHAEEFLSGFYPTLSGGECESVLVQLDSCGAYFALVYHFFPGWNQILGDPEHATIQFVADFPVFALRWLRWLRLHFAKYGHVLRHLAIAFSAESSIIASWQNTSYKFTATSRRAGVARLTRLACLVGEVAAS